MLVRGCTTGCAEFPQAKGGGVGADIMGRIKVMIPENVPSLHCGLRRVWISVGLRGMGRVGLDMVAC